MDQSLHNINSNLYSNQINETIIGGCEYFEVEVGDGLENLTVHLVNVLCGLSSFQPLGQTFFAAQFHLDVQVLVVVPGQRAVGCGQLDGQQRRIAAAVPVRP